MTVPIHVARTLEDAAAIRERLTLGGKILIVGGGIIGLEVAAAASKACDVTVIEAGSRLFERACRPKRPRTWSNCTQRMACVSDMA